VRMGCKKWTKSVTIKTFTLTGNALVVPFIPVRSTVLIVNAWMKQQKGMNNDQRIKLEGIRQGRDARLL
jgi:hypothetical protein